MLKVAMWAAVSASFVRAAENTPEFRAALVKEKKYAEAHKAFREALNKEPENPALLFNTGLMAYLAGTPAESIAPWSKLKSLVPENPMVRSKLIQAYEAVGKKKERDAERAELFKLRETTNDEDFKESAFYCRDQFPSGKRNIMVFEYYELKGDRAVRYSFNVIEPDGSISAKYSLGSYETTNQIARETGALKAGQRMFHLDAYLDQGRSHSTYGMYVGEPEYDATKKMVQEILDGKRKPSSSSSAVKKE